MNPVRALYLACFGLAIFCGIATAESPSPTAASSPSPISAPAGGSVDLPLLPTPSPPTPIPPPYPTPFPPTPPGSPPPLAETGVPAGSFPIRLRGEAVETGFGAFWKEAEAVAFTGQRVFKTTIVFYNFEAVPYDISLSVANASGGIEIEIEPQNLMVVPQETPKVASGSLPGPLGSPPPVAGTVFVTFRVPADAKKGDVFDVVIEARGSRVDGGSELSNTFSYQIRVGSEEVVSGPALPFLPGATAPTPAAGAPTADSKLLADLGWVAMGSFAAPVKADLGGVKTELELHMSQYAKAESLEKRVPTFLVLMKVSVPTAVAVDQDEVLDLLSGYLTTSLALQVGAGSKPFHEVERTTVTAAGENSTARIYSGEIESTPVKGLLAVWRSGSLLLGALAVGPEEDYGDIQELLAGSKLPNITATPGFEAVIAALALVAVELIRRRGQRR